MKLIPRAKPIKIRILSGGDERDSLDSLQRHFCWEDVKKVIANGSLEKWLRRLGENEIADDFMKRQGSDLEILDAYNLLFRRKNPFTSSDQVYAEYDERSRGVVLTALVKELIRDLSYEDFVRISPKLKRRDNFFQEKLVELAIASKNKDTSQGLFEKGEYLFNSHKEIATELINLSAKKGNPNAIRFINTHREYFKEVTISMPNTLNKYVLAFLKLRPEIISKWEKSKELNIACSNNVEWYVLKFCSCCNRAFWSYKNEYDYRDAVSLGSAFFSGIAPSDPLYELYVFVRSMLSPHSPAESLLKSICHYPPASEILSNSDHVIQHLDIYLQMDNAIQNVNQLKKIIERLEYFLKYVDPSK